MVATEARMIEGLGGGFLPFLALWSIYLPSGPKPRFPSLSPTQCLRTSHYITVTFAQVSLANSFYPPLTQSISRIIQSSS